MNLINIDGLIDLFNQHFECVKLRSEAHQDWKDLAQVSLATSEYLHTTIDYHRAYLNQAQDISIVIYAQNNAVAIWPLTLNNNLAQQRLQSNCKAILPPSISPLTGKKHIKKLYQQCLNFLSAFALKYQQEIKLSYFPEKDLSWQRTITPYISSIVYQQVLLVNLTHSFAELKQDFRKSYRGLINKGLSLWEHKVYTTMSDDLLEQFRQFHIEIAGKETRSRETWQLQQKMINEGEAFYITLYDKGNKNKLVGGALFNLSPAQASYSVGVYDRSLFDQPISHVIQHLAINHFKEIGVECYVLGLRHHSFEHPAPTSKETSIGFFKEGFSNTTAIEATVTLAFTPV